MLKPPRTEGKEPVDDKFRSRSDVFVIIALWVLCSNLFNASSKMVSSHNPWTAFVTTAMQLGGASCVGLIAMRATGRNFKGFYQPLIKAVPIGIGLAVANGSMMWALSRTSIGMFQTVKASTPLFTAFACHVFLGRRYTLITYATLLPIMLGLAAASATDLEADTLGLAACVLSSVVQVYVNLSAKQLLEKSFVDLDQSSIGSDIGRFLRPFELQCLVSIVGFLVCLLSVFLVILSSAIPGWVTSQDNQEIRISYADLVPPLGLLFVNVILYSCENVLAYSTNGKLSRLPFAVVDAIRRLSIVITFNIIFSERTPGPVNLAGVIAVAAGSISFATVVEER